MPRKSKPSLENVMCATSHTAYHCGRGPIYGLLVYFCTNCAQFCRCETTCHVLHLTAMRNVGHESGAQGTIETRLRTEASPRNACPLASGAGRQVRTGTCRRTGHRERRQSHVLPNWHTTEPSAPRNLTSFRGNVSGGWVVAKPTLILVFSRS